MTTPNNNQEFYDALDKTCAQLREIGMATEADQITHRLHAVSWTTTSELFEELEVVLKNVLAGTNAAKMSPELKSDISSYVQLLATT